MSVVISVAFVVLPKGITYSVVPRHVSSCSLEQAALSQKPTQQDQTIDQDLSIHSESVLYRPCCFYANNLKCLLFPPPFFFFGPL